VELLKFKLSNNAVFLRMEILMLKIVVLGSTVVQNNSIFRRFIDEELKRTIKHLKE
jgi:hypothetical protein